MFLSIYRSESRPALLLKRFKTRHALFRSVFSPKVVWRRLQGAIYRPDSFVLMLRYYANLKAIRYESTSLNRIVVDESHRVT